MSNEFVDKNSDKTKRGFLILEEGIGLDVLKFLSLTREHQRELESVKINWKPNTRKKDTHDYLYSCFQAYNKNPSLYLFILPPAIVRDFRITDLDFPVQMSGFVVIVNIKLWMEFAENLEKDGKERKPTSPVISDLAWAKSHNLPVVVAAIHARNINRDVNKLGKLLAQPVTTPIIWCDGEIDKDLVDRTLQLIADI